MWEKDGPLEEVTSGAISLSGVLVVEEYWWATDERSGRSPECEVMAAARIVGSGGEGGGASDANRFQRRNC